MPHTMLRFPTVKARTGLSRSTIYLRISRGTFSAPVSLGGRAVGWIEAEVHAWLTARIAQRRPIAPAERGSSHDLSHKGGPSMTPRHTTPAPVAHGGVRALAHGRGRGGCAKRISTVMEWAVAMDLRADNPCDRIGPVLGPQQNLVQHMRALPHREALLHEDPVGGGAHFS